MIVDVDVAHPSVPFHFDTDKANGTLAWQPWTQVFSKNQLLGLEALETKLKPA